ncbi:unnamed protein product [Stenotrophomonas maltophilia]|nr:unnamed protein product [Stenotrophomonas maltophilia]
MTPAPLFFARVEPGQRSATFCISQASSAPSAAGTPKTGSALGIPTNERLSINKRLDDSEGEGEGEGVTLRQSG